MSAMKVCVFHERMGNEIGASLHAAEFGLDVEVVTDTSQDPPCADAIEVLVANTFPRGMLGRCPKLRWLQLTGAGADHVLEGAPREGLQVTHAANVPAVAVAEFVWMGLLALAKDAAALVRQQDARLWRPPKSRLLAGSTLVIAGLGPIGREIARRARGFEVRTVAITRSGRPSPLVDEVRPSSMLPDALRDASALVIALPANRHTTCPPLIDEAAIRALPQGAVLINIARAAVLDHGALLRALDERRLHAALLDVHEKEPLPPDSPLWAVENLWITPHGAFVHPGEAAELSRLILDNLARFLAGAELCNRVDLSELAGPRSPDPI
ncbi:NAD(P)-dependent oxidoreductase [Polyangium sp. 15x6]|uniref:NAD(P)-dependent oxidoreductase n=1 Tax=Polyangium sp. 15x6 TaxID=3042687 RepID=UPI00249A1C32|nr:NAD(P)-dependent oxidoreductase [Polyangium sp. 15x6]MDI3291366.1 NAD(P)-dependent oxidoreductase [Polyangium sp. 15x6]